MVENLMICPICLGDIEDGVEWCSSNCQEQYCKPCIVSYVECAINSHVLGACPPICCPSLTHVTKKEKEILKQEKWKMWISEEASLRYCMIADSLLQFRCGSCHTQSSIDAGHKEEAKETVDALFETHFSASIAADFSTEVTAYCNGDVTSDAFYVTILSKFFPQLSSLENDLAWDIFIHVLHTIADPERRVNLHLRYLRDRPQFKTPCCKSAHCFNCKSHSHEGVSCIENESKLDNSIVHCPECNIALVKGDGCSSISCVCGAHFCWETEKNKKIYLTDFIAAYPENTSRHAAIIICESSGDESEFVFQQAKAWQGAHRIEVNAEMCNWFRRKYAHCVAQCVAKRNELPHGQEAADLLRPFMQKEVEKCFAETATSRAVLFTSVFTTAEERAFAASRLLRPSAHGIPENLPFWGSAPELTTSAMRWVESNRNIVADETKMYELRQAKQFLYLYGLRNIQSTVRLLAHSKEELRKMFRAFLKQMNIINNYKEYVGLFSEASTEVSSLQQSDAEWITVCGGDKVLATARYDAMDADITQILHICSYARSDYSNLQSLGTLTWSELISAMSWARVHKASEWEESDCEIFNLFDD